MTCNRILVIDDEPHIRDIISRKLSGAGFEVQTACNGVEGLELVRAITPCLLITDLQMPKMNGLKVCAACREDLRTRKLPIIMVTGSVMTNSEIKLKLEPLGNIRCISKPFSPKELLSMVQDILAENTVKGD